LLDDSGVVTGEFDSGYLEANLPQLLAVMSSI
jgi:acetyl-CoA carboxylase biotin carboxylase subunit